MGDSRSSAYAVGFSGGSGIAYGLSSNLLERAAGPSSPWDEGEEVAPA